MRSTRRVRAGVATSLVLMLTGCAGTPHQLSEGIAPDVGTSRTVISGLELRRSGVTTTYDALRRIRPELLKQRQIAVVNDAYNGFPVVYVDGRLQGSADLLNTVPIDAILYVEYLTPTEGYFRISRVHPGGVLDVRTRR